MPVSVSITGQLSTALRAAANALEGAGRAELSAAMGHEVQEVTVTHLSQLAATRHTTAERLGASPSNHLAQAAEKAAAPAALKSDGNAATLTINHVGLARAFHDVTIVPVKAKALAIPIAAMAYNRYPAQLTLEGHHLFVLGGKKFDTGRRILAEKMPDGTVLPLFLLVSRVVQRQDRTLLPSNAEWEAAAAAGARGYIAQKLREGGNLAA